MKKKIIVIVLLLVLVFALVACGEPDTDVPDGGETPGGDKPSGGEIPGGGDNPIVDIDNSIFTSDMTLDEIVNAFTNYVQSYSIDYEDKTTDYVGAKPGDTNRNFSSHCRFTKTGYSYSYYKFEKNYEIAFFFENDIFYELYNTGEYIRCDITDYTGYDYVIDMGDEYSSMFIDAVELAKSGAQIKIEGGKITISKGDYEYIIYGVNKTSIAIPQGISDYKSKEPNIPTIKYEPLEGDNTKCSVAEVAFYLRSVEIPQTIDGMSVVAIDNALTNNEHLKKITISNGITTLAPYVFSPCKNLTDIVYKGTKAEWHNLVKVSKCEVPQRITVTCTDGVYDEDEFVMFKSDMTKDRILDIINNSKYLALDVNGDKQYNNNVAYYIGETGIYCQGSFNKNATPFKSIMFYDGTVFYEYDDQMEEVYYDATDYAGYDIDLKTILLDLRKELLSVVIESISTGYTIENGCLKTGIYTVRYWDGKSEVELPSIFDDYKNMQTNSPVAFELSADKSYYILTYISNKFRSYVVPQTYEGLPVKEISGTSLSHLKNITIPVCIEKLPESGSVGNDINIVYGGTMKQWYGLSKDLEWATSSSVKVVCSDGEYSYDALRKQVDFSEDMSKEEVIQRLKDLKYFIFRFDNDAIYYVGDKLMILNLFIEGVEMPYIYEFFEGKRGYEIEIGGEMRITDFTGYDVDIDTYFACYMNDGLKDVVYENVANGKYSIEDGCLVAYEESEDESERYKYVIQPCIEAPTGTIPEGYEDYATRETTEDTISYTLSEDEKYYTLSYIKEYFHSFEVPETYNGLPVTKLSASTISTFENIVIPTSITEIPSSVYDISELNSRTLNIEYKGTKEQWHELSKDLEWTRADHIKVTCSDGVYDNTTAQ